MPYVSVSESAVTDAIANGLDIYLSTAEAAQILRCNEIKLRHSRSIGLLYGHRCPPYIKLSERKILYRRSDLLAWIDEHNIGNADTAADLHPTSPEAA